MTGGPLLLSVLAVLVAATVSLLLPPTGAGPPAVAEPGDGAATGGSAGTSSPVRTEGPGHDRALVVRAGAVIGAVAATWVLLPASWSPIAAAGAGLLTWRWSATWEAAAARYHRARLEAALPHVVDLFVVALEAGLGPAEALDRVVAVSSVEVRHELQVPRARLRLGADPVGVWTELAGHPQLGRLGVTLRRASESGAPVGAALSRLAADLRADQRGEVSARVRRIETRAAVPLGVCLLPAFVLLGVVPLVAGSVLSLLGG